MKLVILRAVQLCWRNGAPLMQDVSLENSDHDGASENDSARNGKAFVILEMAIENSEPDKIPSGRASDQSGRLTP